MIIFLYGPPGAGKTTIGRATANLLDWPFLDLDDAIHAKTGRTPGELIRQDGEPAFRAIESATLLSIDRQQPGVVALGGGALLDEKNRQFAQKNGLVILLTADLPVLLNRLQHSAIDRPLVSDDLISRLGALMLSRQQHYASFPDCIAVDHLSIEDAAWEVCIHAGHLRVTGMGQAYPVTVQSGSLANLPEDNRRIHLVTDQNLARSWLNELPPSIQRASQTILEPGEASKTLTSAQTIWTDALQSIHDRKSRFMALGGGVIGDLTGFAAATFLRGIEWVNLPTSLLAMVDAGIGGKTGVNLPEGKNLVGSFHPPAAVIIDPRVIQTLPVHEFRQGMAEVIKHALFGDPQLLSMIEAGPDAIDPAGLQHLITRAAAVKVRIVNADPYEHGPRYLLNLGHTIGHAIESASHYTIPHGSAVAIGLHLETLWAEQASVCESGTAQRVAALLNLWGLPVLPPDHLDPQALSAGMLVDKKRSIEKVRLPHLHKIGQASYDQIVDVDALLAIVRKHA